MVHFLPAQDFFIHLSEAGDEQRALLLENRHNLSSLKKTAPDTAYQFSEIEPHLQKRPGLKNWLMLSGPSARSVAVSLQNDGVIDWVDSVGYFKVSSFGNDSLISQQWFLNKIGLDEAWKYGKGDSSIVVGVLDTGVDYRHDDLWQGLWINRAEDINHNGRLDEGDNNGIDDDGNGYIDDVIGWDFTDAPRFADGGDYLTPDNDPMDEFGSGHGTEVAGLIIARNNNITGGTGIAPGCRVMVLRAGTASGYLEEDDAARGILYALDNGARILNMSFGDVTLSRFLKDVIQYAAERGLVMVASAGNSGRQELNYPASLSETIAVGATTESGALAGFSTYNNAIDLVAPGQDILSTAVGNGFESLNGTSFSAPIVSAACALLLSKNPQTSQNEIRNILKTGADDFLYSGWDIFSGAGKLNIGRALNIPHGGMLIFNYPQENGSVSGDSLKVRVTAAHPQLLQTRLSIGIGAAPETFRAVGSFQRQFLNEQMAVIDLGAYPDTLLTLRMEMDLQDGGSDEVRTSFHKDQTPPVISDVNLIPLLDGTGKSVLVTFHTDDICTAHLKIQRAGGNAGFVTMGDAYETRNHRIKLDFSDFAGAFDFFIEARNLGGLTSRDDAEGALYHFDLENKRETLGFQKIPWTLPAGYMLNKAVDLDHDGHKEIVISRYDEKNAFGPIEIYEFENGIFQLRLKSSFKAIPRDAGDVDGDGKSDLLLGFGQYSFLFEAGAPDSFPNRLVWQDTSAFWAAGYTDGDNDGIMEIAGYKNNVYHLLESRSADRFTDIAALPNPTDGANRLGVPKIESVDFDGDGKKELVYGDYDGDLIAYVGVGDNKLALKAAGHTWHSNATELFTADDNRIITATHTSENQNFEHEFDARFWSIESHALKQNKLISRDTLNTFGYASTRDFDSGLMFARLDTMQLLFAAFFPNLYIFQRRNDRWQPVYSRDQVRSNTVVVADMDDDGFDEFYFNDGREIVGYSAGQGDRPAVPQLFKTEMLDSLTARLSWQGNAPAYRIFRGETPEQLTAISQTTQTAFTDSLSGIGVKYYYRTLAVDSSFTQPLSYFSALDSVITAHPPRVVAINFPDQRQCLLQFDRKLSFKPDKKARASRLGDGESASSVLLGSRSKSLLITFAVPFHSGLNDSLILEHIFGESGVPVKAEKIAFYYVSPQKAPVVRSWNWIGARTLHIIFSQTMQPPETVMPVHYSLEPGGKIEKIVAPVDSPKTVKLFFARNVPLGASGIASYLRIKGLHSAAGVGMEKDAIISLNRDASGGLKDLLVYPQPLRPEDDQLVFAHIRGNVTITIFNLNGQKIKTITAGPEYGGIKWDLSTDSRQKIESGVYLYDVRSDKSAKQGKVIIIR